MDDEKIYIALNSNVFVKEIKEEVKQGSMLLPDSLDKDFIYGEVISVATFLVCFFTVFAIFISFMLNGILYIELLFFTQVIKIISFLIFYLLLDVLIYPFVQVF